MSTMITEALILARCREQKAKNVAETISNQDRRLTLKHDSW
ncbi:hypothetical protein [Candidatus Ruthia endofausta]|nr:hypothetical protein [Candidatus Ruthia endofausta]